MKNHLKRLGILSLITFMIFGMVITPDIGNLNQGQPLAITTNNNNDTEESTSDSPVQSTSLALSLDNLEMAEKTARWLYNQRTTTPYGITWPNELNNFTLTYENGVAGIGDFFLELYELTTNATYLSWANQIGWYLNHESVIKADPGKYSTYSGEVGAKNYTGVLSGSAGIGKFLVRLYKNTNNASYKTLAEDIAQELTSSAVISPGGTGIRIKTQDFEPFAGLTVLPSAPAQVTNEFDFINFYGSLTGGSWNNIGQWSGDAQLTTATPINIAITHNMSATGEVQITKTTNSSRDGEAFVQNFISNSYPIYLNGIKVRLRTDRAHPTSYLVASVYEASESGYPIGNRIGAESQRWNSSFTPTATIGTWVNFNWSSSAPVLNGSAQYGYVLMISYGDSGAVNTNQSFFIKTAPSNAYGNGKMALLRNAYWENYRDALFNVTVLPSSRLMNTRIALNTTNFGIPPNYNTNNLINMTVKAVIRSSIAAISALQIFNWATLKWEVLSYFSTTNTFVNQFYSQPLVRNYVGGGERPMYLRVISGDDDSNVIVYITQLNVTLHYTDEIYAYSWGDGAAGIGDFLLDCYEIMDDPAYLMTASLLGNYLIEEKTTVLGSGGVDVSHWDLFGEVALNYRNGNAGIGDFLLRLSRFNSTNPNYLATALAAARKIMSTGTPIAGYNRYGTFLDSLIMKDQGGIDYPTGFLDGIAGMGTFLMRLMQSYAPQSMPYDIYSSVRQMANLMVSEKLGTTKYTQGPLINHITSVEFSPLIQNGTEFQNNTYGNSEAIPTLAEGLGGVMTFLSLYQGQTLDSSHGDAIGAALKYLVNNATQHVPSGGNYWNYNLTYRLTTSVVSKYGLMHGMAGIGLSLLKTNVRARDGVTTAASLATQTEALRISTNPVRYTGGYYGLGQGVAGVGLGYIEQYRLTSDSTYFTRAQACADTLKNPIYWRESSTSTANISGLDKGLAGIGLFQLRMFQTSGDSSYLDTSITIANALVARQTGGRWPYSLTDSTYYTNYADGAAGIIYFLIELYKMTQSVTYLNSIEAGLYWLELEQEVVEKYWGPSEGITAKQSSYLGYSYGTAGIADVFVSAYMLTQNATYLTILQNAARYLGGVYTLRNIFPRRDYSADNSLEYIGYDYGVAGYIKFLLHLIEIPSIAYRANYIANISHAVYRLITSLAQEGLTSEQRFWSDSYTNGLGSGFVTKGYWNSMAGLLDILSETVPLMKTTNGEGFTSVHLNQIARGKNYIKAQASSTYSNVGYFSGMNGIAQSLCAIADTDYPTIIASNPSVNPIVEYNQNLVISVDTEDLGSGISSVKLYFSINGGTFQTQQLNPTTGTNYQGLITNLPWLTTVEYYIVAQDSSSVSTPILAPGEQNFVYIVQDTRAPTYSDLQITVNYGINGGGLVSLKISDDAGGVGGASGLFTYTIVYESPNIPSGPQFGTLIKLPGSDDTYYYQIPATYTGNTFLRAGEDFTYTITVRDYALNTLTITDTILVGDTVDPVLNEYVKIQPSFEINENTEVEIKVKVSDFEALGGSGIKRVFVKYSSDNTINAKDWQEIDLAALGDNTFGGKIPGQARNQYIFYYICAEDNMGNKVAFSAKNAEGDIFTYSIEEVPEVLYYYHVVTNWTRILIIVGISVAAFVGIYLVWKYRGSYLDRMRREATSAATMISIKEKFLSIYYRIAEKMNEWGDKMSKKYYDATLKEKVADWLEDNKDSPLAKFIKGVGGGVKQILKYALVVILFPFLAFWALVTQGKGKRLILAALIGMLLIVASVIKFFGDDFYPMRAIFFIDFGFVLFIGAFVFIILHLIYEISAK